MLIIRLQRTGKKNQADFRIVLAQKTASASKKFVEVLGSYNPRKKAFVIKNEERLKYWLAQHVELSPTLHNLLVSNKLLDAKKVKAFKTPKKPVEPVASPAASTPAQTEPTVAPTTPSADAATPPQAGGETATAAPAVTPEVPAVVSAPEVPVQAPEASPSAEASGDKPAPAEQPVA